MLTSFRVRHVLAIAALALVATACAARVQPSSDDHRGHDTAAMSPGAVVRPNGSVQDSTLPAGAAEAEARLAASPRHGEWVMVGTGGTDSVRAWVVYPERRDRAPVVLVVHEIFGLSPWIRAVADQFAVEGFIAVAPDLLTSKNIPGSPLNP
ncbi:MAG TPA: dienelactone hydrolase family protein, partial [Gemmatimonadaceae bacterium]|nr:dienelactone hydrolase family protein [Gemmatimonadaceae bacterium]